MRWGRVWGLRWGWEYGPKSLPQTVEVMIVRGKYQPCFSCHWFNTCVVPRGKHHARYDRQPIRIYYQCEDYFNRKAVDVTKFYGDGR
jgi:hypothetical protein